MSRAKLLHAFSQLAQTLNLPVRATRNEILIAAFHELQTLSSSAAPGTKVHLKRTKGKVLKVTAIRVDHVSKHDHFGDAIRQLTITCSLITSHPDLSSHSKCRGATDGMCFVLGWPSAADAFLSTRELFGPSRKHACSASTRGRCATPSSCKHAAK